MRERGGSVTTTQVLLAVVGALLWLGARDALAGRYLVTDLGGLGGSYAEPWAVNDKGQVVGWASTAGEEEHAFLYDNGLMTDLNSLLPAGSPWLVTYAQGINNRGQIVAEGYRDGVARAILMTPADPAQVDFDGDAKTDVTIWRPSTGTWHIRCSADSAMTSVPWGDADDVRAKSRY